MKSNRHRQLELYQHALELNREIDRYSEGVSPVNAGEALLDLDLDRAGEAIGYLQQARDTYAEVDYADGAGYAVHTLGRCYLSLRRDAEALSCCKRRCLATGPAVTGTGRRRP